MFRMVLAAVLVRAAVGMAAGSEQLEVGPQDMGGSSGSAADVVYIDPAQLRQRREDDEEEEEAQQPEQNPGRAPDQPRDAAIARRTPGMPREAAANHANAASLLADRMTAREAAAVAPHARQMMRVEAVGSGVADMVLIPDCLTPVRYFGQGSHLIPGDREIIASMTNYSDAGFVTTTYRMQVTEVHSIRSTHAEWLISSRDVVGLGSRLVVRHFTLPRENEEVDAEGAVVL